MRKTILLILALIITFGVLAKNPHSTSAPGDETQLAVAALPIQTEPGVAVITHAKWLVPTPAITQPAAAEVKAENANAAVEPVRPVWHASIVVPEMPVVPEMAVVPEKAAAHPVESSGSGLAGTSGRNAFDRKPDDVELKLAVTERKVSVADSGFVIAERKLSAVSTKPVAVSTKPVAVSKKPVVVSTKPVAVRTRPSAASTKPVAVSTKPVAVRTRPSAANTKPVAFSTKPVAIAKKPVAVRTGPSAVSTKPNTINTSPIAATAKPILARSSPSVIERRPSAVIIKPSAVSTKPVAVSTRPSAVIAKPNAVSLTPRAAKSNPGVTSRKPIVADRRPGAVASKPSVVISNTKAANSKPNVVKSNPSLIEERPSILNRKPNVIGVMPPAVDPKLVSFSLLDMAQSRYLRLNIDGWQTTAAPPVVLTAAPEQTVDGTFCDKNFVGGPIIFSQTAELTLDDLLFQIHNRFGINFLMGDGIGNLPINIKTGSIPWNTLLSSQLFVSGVRATCIAPNTIQLVLNEAMPKLQSTAEVKPTFIKLKYLQPSSGGNVDIAGRSSSGGGGSSSQGGGCQSGGGGGQSSGGGSQNCGPFEKLIIEIEKILGIRSLTQSSIGGGGGGGGFGGGGGSQGQTTEPIKTNRQVSQVPGRSMLLVRATEEELVLINELIVRADRAPFQVVIRGLIYTANENKLRDIGIQTSIFAQKADGTTSGGIFGQSVPSSGTLFDISSLVGTVEFNATANALQQNGVISIKSRPFATVLDGDTADLDVGRQIPVLIQAQNSLGGTPGTLEILDAGNILSVTPFVLDDENGKPIGVNLTLQLESNDVDTSVTSQGVPSVNRRSIQTRLILNQDKTVILGGFTVDSDSRDVTKTPGIGDIPILGNLFKRKVRRSELNRLYFAISVEVMTYPKVNNPANVPGATTDIPSITPNMKKRGDAAEPKQVVEPAKDDGP